MVDMQGTAAALAGAIARGEATARDALEACFEAVDARNPAINAIIWQERERARAVADARDAARAAGDALGPLHGVPMTIKESFQWAGTPVTFGIADFRDNRPQGTAVVVERLEAAGAVIFGKTNVPFALADFQSYNAIYGVTGNPWDPSRVPGGSSGGSAAALAAGMTFLDYGSDIGGSIRNPAHFCGVFGHKPTWGAVPPGGHGLDASLSPTDLAVVGPLARSAGDLALLFGVTAGPDAGDPPFVLKREEVGLKGLRVAVWGDDALCRVSSGVRGRVAAVADALRAAGALVSEAARPGFDAAAAHATYQDLLQAAFANRMPDADFAQAIERAERGDPARASTHLARRQVMRHRDWYHASERRLALRAAWQAFFRAWDVVVAPIMPTTAYPHDHRPEGERTVDVDGVALPYYDQLFWPGLATLPGLPATVFPAGLADGLPRGLPVGLQIIGPMWGDWRTLGVAARLEQIGFGFVRPPA
jgi:amidase